MSVRFHLTHISPSINGHPQRPCWGLRGGRIDFPTHIIRIHLLLCGQKRGTTYAGKTELPSVKRTPTGLSEYRKDTISLPSYPLESNRRRTLKAQALEVGNVHRVGRTNARTPDETETCKGYLSKTLEGAVENHSPVPRLALSLLLKFAIAALAWSTVQRSALGVPRRASLTTPPPPLWHSPSPPPRPTGGPHSARRCTRSQSRWTCCSISQTSSSWCRLRMWTLCRRSSVRGARYHDVAGKSTHCRSASDRCTQTSTSSGLTCSPYISVSMVIPLSPRRMRAELSCTAACPTIQPGTNISS